MFTGIIQTCGTVTRLEPAANGIRLTLRARGLGRGLKIGASVAVNGCCLTLTGLAKGKAQTRLRFDLLQETWQRTNLQFVRPGSLVNLERPLRADGEWGGHFVTGHVDGLGKIVRWEKSGADHLLEITAPPEVRRYLIFKGSVTVDGISLTVAAVRANRFRLWIIPHTFAVTALRERKVGDAVNLEADLLGKYAEKMLAVFGRRRSHPPVHRS